jgi:ribose-phosphate pyrophosphokinase
METMLLLDTCKRSGSESISVIMPAFPYSRSDKKDNGRVAIGASLVMSMLQPYANRIISLDMHAGQIQGFTFGPSDNLYAMNLFCKYLQDEIFSNDKDINDINEKYILISPDAGGEKRTKAYSTKLQLTSCILTKQRSYSQMNCVISSSITGDRRYKRN